MLRKNINRRDFLKGITATGVAALGVHLGLPASALKKHTKENDDGEHFVFMRLKYNGGDWYTGVDDHGASQSDIQISKKLREYTNIPVEIDGEEAQYIRLDDPEVFSYPFLYITGHRGIDLSELERRNFREFLERGGFMLIDDSWGFDSAVRRVLKEIFPDKVSPDGKGPLEPIPIDHPIYKSFFPLKMPGKWDVKYGRRGASKLFDPDTKDGLKSYKNETRLHSDKIWGGDKQSRPWHEGIFINDRLALFYTMNDLGDAWEGHQCRPHGEQQREWAFQMGINIIVYALTH